MIDLNISPLRAAVVAGCCFVSLASYGCEQKQAEAPAPEAAPNSQPTKNTNLTTTINSAAHQESGAPPAAANGVPPPTTTINSTAHKESGAPPAPPNGVAPPTAPSAPSPASEQQIAELSKPSGGANGGMYTVKEGTKVDPNTLMGWKTWRALACDRCHGAEQQGLVGPPLLVSMHRITKDQFKQTLTAGRPEKGMPPFNGSPMVMANLENLYAYLKGRADAQIQAGHLYPLETAAQ